MTFSTTAWNNGVGVSIGDAQSSILAERFFGIIPISAVQGLPQYMYEETDSQRRFIILAREGYQVNFHLTARMITPFPVIALASIHNVNPKTGSLIECAGLDYCSDCWQEQHHMSGCNGESNYFAIDQHTCAEGRTIVGFGKSTEGELYKFQLTANPSSSLNKSFFPDSEVCLRSALRFYRRKNVLANYSHSYSVEDQEWNDKALAEARSRNFRLVSQLKPLFIKPHFFDSFSKSLPRCTTQDMGGWSHEHAFETHLYFLDASCLRGD